MMNDNTFFPASFCYFLHFSKRLCKLHPHICLPPPKINAHDFTMKIISAFTIVFSMPLFLLLLNVDAQIFFLHSKKLNSSFWNAVSIWNSTFCTTSLVSAFWMTRKYWALRL